MDASDQSTNNDNKDGAIEVQQNAPILVMLDDNCLMEIFGHLDVDDLLNVANVCIRFNQNAKSVYSLKFKKIQLQLSPVNSDDWLLNFGSMMESVHIPCVAMLEAISKHCKSLKNLHIAPHCRMSPFIQFVQLDEGLLKECQPLFAHLDKLTFEDCLLVDHVKTGLIGCQQLKSLEIKNTLLAESEIEVNGYDRDERHERAQLMPFVILQTSELFQSIGENTPNLTELYIHVKYMDDQSNFQNDVLSLCNLRSLSVLDMHVYGESASNLMKAFAENDIPIEDLKLKDGKIDMRGIESICKIQSLRKIAFHEFYGFDVDYLIPLARDLPHLSSLDIEHPELGEQHNDENHMVLKKIISHGKRLSTISILNIFGTKFGMQDYETILTVVENRKEKCGLKICFGCIYMDEEDCFEMKTELENGEKFEVSVHFY